CNNRCLHCYVEEGRKKPTMLFERWKAALKKCWEIGVPHICFTGGEPTLVEFLPQLVEAAEDIGMVTGLLTNGRRLSDEKLVSKLAEAGIDHFQITVESDDRRIHDEMVGVNGAFEETVKGLENAVKAGVYTLTNTTVTRLNVERIEETVKFIADKGVRVFAMNGLIHTGRAPESGLGLSEEELEGVVGRAVRAAEERGMRFIWYTPTKYCSFDPIAHGLGIKQCSAARYNMCIEPDGSLLPCQSYYEVVGNFLDEEWERLWEAPLCVSLRRREWVEERCRSCERFSECGGGCPLYKRVEKLHCLDVVSATPV
ncbi:MAG: radical SAM protein, partial [Planctomycetota bacterium]|nr:radical SAM protein [Planctomycetota bacterium]